MGEAPSRLAARPALTAAIALPLPAAAQQEVRHIAVTASGMPNNGSEGMRFLGVPVFEPLVD